MNGFTGDFCEYITDQNHLLFISEGNQLIFNASGNLVGENAVFNERLNFRGICSTNMFGETIIFGGDEVISK